MQRNGVACSLVLHVCVLVSWILGVIHWLNGLLGVNHPVHVVTRRVRHTIVSVPFSRRVSMTHDIPASLIALATGTNLSAISWLKSGTLGNSLRSRVTVKVRNA